VYVRERWVGMDLERRLEEIKVKAGFVLHAHSDSAFERTDP
jgi:hypothetical protein